MGKQRWLFSLGLAEKIFLSSLLLIFFGVFLHAPFIVIMGNLWPGGALLIKAWKEIIMTIALTSALFILWRQNRWAILDNWLVKLIGAYVLLGLICVSLFKLPQNAVLAGLLIDYRYVLAFFLFFIAGKLYPQLRSLLVQAGTIGMFIVVAFGVLQVFFLPHNFLEYLGYNKTLNIAPYLTVDENYNYIRINSTLRGPNVLGAMMVISLSAITSYFLLKKKQVLKSKQLSWFLGFMFIGSVVNLWVSYSRSALGAAILSLLIIVVIIFRHKIKVPHIIGFLTGFLLMFTGMIALKDNHFVSTVFLHEDPNEAGLVNSNHGHKESVIEGITLMAKQPAGAGVGSTGSASLFTQKPIIIENQYLFIAHELGWMGLLLFLAISFTILVKLWQQWLKSTDWLTLAVFSSGIGLMVIGLVLPVWVDDTVSIVWWALAGFLIGNSNFVHLNKGKV